MAEGFSIGSLVSARNREWVVQPGSDTEDGFLLVAPLDGNVSVPIAIDTTLEDVVSASFGLPSLENNRDQGGTSPIGNLAQSKLLRDAVRLSFRNAAGPFRSLSRIGVEPRPYQLVPLMMALRQETIRLLIADDVGVGKTIEALLIAREMVDRGEIDGFSVLCPPHLAEQWKDSLTEQFGFEDVTLVLASTARRLEKGLKDGDDSIFRQHPITVVSLDFIKRDEWRASFLRTMPKLVIVDEAHGCTEREGRSGQRQIRHQLLQKIAEKEEQHMILVTATPHSGHQDAFASLLGHLNPKFRLIAASETPSRSEREEIAKHLVQRRRVDIRRDFADMGATFPQRDEKMVDYTLPSDSNELFKQVVGWCRGRIEAASRKNVAKVRYWSMLSLMRAMASSPDAAIAGLRSRSDNIDEEEPRGDEIEAAVFDLDSERGAREEVISSDQLGTDDSTKARIEGFIQSFEDIKDNHDEKLEKLKLEIGSELENGFSPIVFCRFVPTVDYVASALQESFPKAHVEGITGRLSGDERLRRVHAMGEADDRILVCTDCLAEGVNLQEKFDSVIHYDLSWSPTTHEQREGRVDRFGQPNDVVHAISMVGQNNIIDGIVANIIIEKQRKIRAALGITVPAPNAVAAIQAAVEEGFLSEIATSRQVALFEFTDTPEERRKREEKEWVNAAERESKRRSIFAQSSIKVSEVAQEVAAVRRALGDPEMIADFIEAAVAAHGATPNRDGKQFSFTTEPLDERVKEIHSWNLEEKLAVVDDLSPVPRGFQRVVRTSPIVERLANHVMGTSLDPKSGGLGRRLSAIRTNAITERTTLILARVRFSLTTSIKGKGAVTNLVEELITLAFTGDIDEASWLNEEEIEDLWSSLPSGNVPPEQAVLFLKPVVEGLNQGVLDTTIQESAEIVRKRIEDGHQRVRLAARLGGKVGAKTHDEQDILSLSVLLPGID